MYYWNREKKSSSAEVDYLIPVNNVVIPVEVKAGASGSLKSLQVFISEKRAPAALRFNSMTPSITELTVKINGTPGHPYLFCFITALSRLPGQTTLERSDVGVETGINIYISLPLHHRNALIHDRSHITHIGSCQSSVFGEGIQ